MISVLFQILPFCDIFGNFCFEKSMQNTANNNKCHCPIECEAINYSFSFVSTPFVPDEMCPKKVINGDFLMKEFYVNKAPPQLGKAYKNTICKKILNWGVGILPPNV